MKILVVPDTQVKPGNDLGFLTRIGRFIVDKQPDIIVHLGDHADMPSLSSYDYGKKSFEGRRYVEDIQSAKDGMAALHQPIVSYNTRQAKNGKKQYRPEKHFLLGNHEHRISRAVNDDPKLDGVLSVDDLCYERDWLVHPFLEVVVIGGIAFSHYFVT